MLLNLVYHGLTQIILDFIENFNIDQKWLNQYDAMVIIKVTQKCVFDCVFPVLWLVGMVESLIEDQVWNFRLIIKISNISNIIFIEEDRVLPLYDNCNDQKLYDCNTRSAYKRPLGWSILGAS